MLILLTGGSACGKSTYGEALAVQGPKPLYYIAAMQPYDQECLRKIARHRALRRDKGFETVERYTDVDALVLPQVFHPRHHFFNGIHGGIGLYIHLVGGEIA